MAIVEVYPSLKHTCLLCFCFSRNPAAVILPTEVLDLLEGDLLIPIFHVLRQGASVPAVGLLDGFQGRLWTLDTLISEVTLYKYIHYIYIIVIP